MAKVSAYSVIGLVVAALIAVVLYFTWQPQTVEAPVYDNSVYLRYRFLLKNTGSEVVDNANFSMFAPYPLNEKQKLIQHTTNQPSDLISDEAGNYSFAINNLLIPPFGSKTLSVTLEVATTSEPAGIQENDLTAYLSDDVYLNMDDPLVIELAKQFADKNKQQAAKDIYLWLVNNIQVLNYVKQAKGAKYAVSEKKGDCTEMMHAFMALARLNGIPARAVGGFVVEDGKTVVHANDYHNWAEYYNGKRWVIVDPQKQVFDKTGNLTYVIFRYFDQQRENQAYSQRFTIFDKRIAVSML